MRTPRVGVIVAPGAIAVAVTIAVAAAQTSGGFPGSSATGHAPDGDSPRPFAIHDGVFIEQLTWLEIRDLIRGGKRIALLPIGGIEQSGPYLVVGKHAYVIRATMEAVARKLGDALVAPTVSFVPQGETDPPTGFMRYPGTIGVRPETFKQLLIDVAQSLRVNGFEHVVIVSDHGGNTQLVKGVVKSLSAEWERNGSTIHYVPEYYDYPELAQLAEKQGFHQVDEGLHDDVVISSTIMTVDPEAVRMEERVSSGRFSINGVALAPAAKTIDFGHRVIDIRAEATAKAIRAAIVGSDHDRPKGDE